MAPRSKGSRTNLGEPLAGELADFCEAHYGVDEVKIIRRAVEHFIRDRLASPGETDMRKRYEEARRKRLGEYDNALRLVQSVKGK